MKYFALLALLIVSVHTHGHGPLPEWFVKEQALADERQGYNPVTEQHLQMRELSRATGTWRPMKIYFDMTAINASLTSLGMASKIPFYEKLFRVTGLWWSSALQVNDLRSVIWKKIYDYNVYFKIAQFNTPPAEQGNYDLYVKVKWTNTPGNNNTFAFAGPYNRHPDSQRPTTGDCTIEQWGDGQWSGPDPAANFRKALATTIHEFGHVIAFSSWANHQSHNISYVSVQGVNTPFWKGAQVMAKARAYFGCASGTFHGVPLQVMGSGSLGAHWSESYLGPEGMTPSSGVEPELFSDMTLALCQDSGWYKANYKMAENYVYGVNRGCQGQCSANQCSTSSGLQASANRMTLSQCKSDMFGCSMLHPSGSYLCSKSTNFGSSQTKMGASYDPVDCTMITGSIKRYDPTTGYVYSLSRLPVKAQCNSTNTAYTLTLKKLGINANWQLTNQDVVVNCTAAGAVQYNTAAPQLAGSVNCEHPATFCAARFGNNSSARCPNSCGGYGRCTHQANVNTALEFFRKKMLGGTRKITRMADSGSKWGDWNWDDFFSNWNGSDSGTSTNGNNTYSWTTTTTNSTPQTGSNTGSNAAANTGANAGSNAGSNTGSTAAPQTGSTAAPQTGSNTGSTAGSNTGSTAGSNTGSTAGANTGANTVPQATTSTSNATSGGANSGAPWQCWCFSTGALSTSSSGTCPVY